MPDPSQVVASFAYLLPDTDGHRKTVEFIVAAALEATERDTAKRCAARAAYWQGEAIAPFQTCGCGKGIQQAILAEFGITEKEATR